MIAYLVLLPVCLENRVYLLFELEQSIHHDGPAVTFAGRPDVGVMWEVLFDIEKATSMQIAYYAFAAESLEDSVEDSNDLVLSNVTKALLSVSELKRSDTRNRLRHRTYRKWRRIRDEVCDGWG